MANIFRGQKRIGLQNEGVLTISVFHKNIKGAQCDKILAFKLLHMEKDCNSDRHNRTHLQ